MYTPCPQVEPPYPDALARAARTLLGALLGPARDSPLAQSAARIVMARHPEHARRVEHLAPIVGVTATDLMLANLSYDLACSTFACSTLALATPDGPVLARNMDWMEPDLIARASCIVATEHGLSGGFIGAVGVVSGLSRHGFAVVLNAVPGEINLYGYPMLLFLRHLLDHAHDFADAVALATETPLASPGLLTLVGTRNEERVCVERSARQARQRWADGDRPLVTTNQFRSLEPPDYACPRWAYLAAHAPRLGATPRDEELLELLCHPCVIQSITAQHVIARPSLGTLRMWVPSALLAGTHDGSGDLETLRRQF
jgi:hypothetical protein